MTEFFFDTAVPDFHSETCSEKLSMRSRRRVESAFVVFAFVYFFLGRNTFSEPKLFFP